MPGNIGLQRRVASGGSANVRVEASVLKANGTANPTINHDGLSAVPTAELRIRYGGWVDDLEAIHFEPLGKSSGIELHVLGSNGEVEVGFVRRIEIDIVF